MGLSSSESPIRVDFLPGHFAGVPGRIGLTLAPGKHDSRWERDLVSDLARLRAIYRADVLVSLMEPAERERLGIAALSERAQATGLQFLELPIVDGSVPSSLPEFLALVERIGEAATKGKNVVVHCRGGLGRSGMTVAAVLTSLGVDADEAIDAVRRARPDAIETDEQAAVVRKVPALRERVPAPLYDRFHACLLGGAIGDALGYPIEFDNAPSIAARWGDTPPSPLAYTDKPPALVSDDTQMTFFTAEGLIIAKTPSERLPEIQRAYLRWLWTQRGDTQASGGWLMREPRLVARRAPGNTCLSALVAQAQAFHCPTLNAPPNDSKGCGAIMRTAPIGLTAPSRDAAFELGRDAGVLTHGHPSGYLSAAFFSAMIFDISRGVSAADALAAAGELLACEFGAAETQSFVERAQKLASAGPPSAADVETLGGGWTGESALGIALACYLSHTGTGSEDFARTLWRAVAHGGDSDSTGSLVGNLLGAEHGAAILPPRWVAEVELSDVAESLAMDLYDHAILGARMDAADYG